MTGRSSESGPSSELALGSSAGMPLYLQRARAPDSTPASIQRQKEEELLQAKPDTVQCQVEEEEEAVQARLDPVQRQGEEEEEELQAKADPVQRQGEEEEELLQARSVSDRAPAKVTDNSNGNGVSNPSALPDGLRGGLESLSGLDLSGVRVHRESSRPAQLNALAYTQGKDIHVGPGQEKHLPHEGWHAVQQAQGRVRPTIQAKGVSINDDAALEREADVMGARALQSARALGSRVTRPHGFTLVVDSSADHGTRQTVQRAMKFEYQIKDPDIKNRLFRDDGANVLPLPRKYGPEDHLVKGGSGVRLESESHGQVEFETGWARSWFDLRAQIHEARHMTDRINAEPSKIASNGKSYKKFPFTAVETQHLRPGQGFRVGKGNVWSRRQKAGKSAVKSKYLNVRNGPGTNFEKIDRLNRKDKVEVRETQGSWARIKSGKIKGWVYKPYLTQLWKRYESNVNKYDPEGNETKKAWSRDTALQSHEELLVEVNDTDWYAYIQVSESFSLDQFESFLKQFEDSEDIDPVMGDVSRMMSAHNPAKTPPPAMAADDSNVDRLIKRAGAAFAKVGSDLEFEKQSSSLKNLLLMVIYYIRMGRKNPVKGDPAKWAFHLMSRTNFGSIYMSMPDPEKRLFKNMVYDKKGGIIPMLGLTRQTRVLVEGHGGGKGPTVYHWLRGITKGKDLLSGRGFSGAMGRFRIEDETKSQKGLVRFESRRSQPLVAASGWVEHAFNLFATAMTERSRDSDKGKTGLKVGTNKFLKQFGL